jgi:hypothetical protein
VTGYPTVIVIDRAGKVHLNYGNLDREAGMKKLEQAAAALSITWPIDEKASDAEVVDRMSRLFGHLYGEAIDQALAEP